MTTQTSKHTPGPWSVDDDPRHGLNTLILDRRNDIVASTADSCMTDSDLAIAGSECEANARLIAAAPDLLAACEAMLPHLEAMIERANPAHEDTGHYSDQTAVRLARAAIAKARGGA